VSERRTINTGRNLPVAIGVGLGLGGLAILTLFTIQATFLVLVALLVGRAVWELSTALGTRQIAVPLIPVMAGGLVMFVLAYYAGPRALVAALALTVLAVFVWRLPGGADGYVRDITAGIFVLCYMPLMAGFVALMLAQPRGAHRVLLFLILTVCSDTGGYFTGILFGKHLMVPAISPKKTWEGLAGSVIFCLAGGAIGVILLLNGSAWAGLVLGAGAVIAATLGDLFESMMKRDLDTKDMSSILPGHGGVLDRLDSLLMVAPVAWLLMTVLLPHGH
jgi:phosphatidate cytidylyltransferase